jgi:TolB-like protein/Flp pilus assembly protein TadD
MPAIRGDPMDRLQQVRQIVRRAQTLDPADRETWLAGACVGDASLRREVETALAAEGVTAPLPTGSVGPIPHAPVPVIGERLAQYCIGERLGAGGMGEVFRARDEVLDREVAIKLLPPAASEDPAARARLVREARAAAALNHPSICTVYEVGEAGGRAYIALELIEGRTLADVVAAGPLSPSQVRLYGLQLADALAHAHDRGVVHRDLKSANVIVTADGRVKVLDFGLARRWSATEWESAVTQEAALTLPGTILGTLAYMSPEQLRGEPARAASDIWALGIVLCEMAAGSRPFSGRTEYELVAAVLGDGPVPLPDALPSDLRAVVARCVEKDPDRRLQDGRAVREALTLDPDAQPHAEAYPTALSVRRVRPGAVLTRRQAIGVGAAATAGALAFGGWRWWPAVAGPSLAVLPFGNPAGDEDLEYLCDGVAERLIHQLARLQTIRVSPFSAVLNLKGQQVPPEEAGRLLGVETVLAGAIEGQGDRLVISAALVATGTGTELWSRRYERDGSALLELQDDIAGEIVEGLRLRLTRDERQRLVRHPTEDGEAYDLYLQARYFQRRATEEDYLYARQLLERAVARDQRFALAYAALAGTYAMMATDGLERPGDAWAQVNRYKRQALAVDPDLPEAHAMEHAMAFLFEWDWDAAAQARRELTRLRAGDMDPHFLRALALEHWALGRTGDALALARRTRELDPLSPDLAMLEADYLVHDGRIEAAVALYERSIALEPGNPNPHFGLAEALFLQRRFDEAIEARRRAHAVAGDDRLDAVLATARGEQGYRAVHRHWVALQLEALEARQVTDYVSPLDLARVYAQLGEADRAFEQLALAFNERSPGLVFLKVDRAWDGVRADPRFQDAVRRAGLP